MFRRRPLRRPLRPLQRGRRPRRRAHQQLIRAHKMMEAGNYPGAAEQFEMIARTAESRGKPRAAQLYLQAGRARIFAGHNEPGLAHLKHALSLFANRADWIHFHNIGIRIVNELTQRGLTEEAVELSSYLKITTTGDFAAAENTAAKEPVLPTHCPSCGGAILPDEVNWLNSITAECAYCDSPVREEN